MSSTLLLVLSLVPTVTGRVGIKPNTICDVGVARAAMGRPRLTPDTTVNDLRVVICEPSMVIWKKTGYRTTPAAGASIAAKRARAALRAAGHISAM